MILTDKIQIKITRNTLNYYNSLGYNIKTNDIIEIPIEHLQKGSNIEVKVKCDICGNTKNLGYRSYNKNISNGGYYACSAKCRQEKTKKTMNEKYGSDYAIQTKKIRDKGIKTCLIKYGTEHHSQSPITKEKRKQNDIKKYGVEHSSKSIIVKNKIEQTNMDLYGVKCTLQVPEIIQKSKITKKEKYGDENYNNHLKSKITKKEKYGDEYYNNHEKYLKTCQRLYNTDNTFKVYSDKISKIKIKNFINKYDNNHNIKILKKEGNINTIKCNICGEEYVIDSNLLYHRLKINTIPCTKCNPINEGKSGLEIEVFNFIKDNYDDIIIESTRDVINPYELDIYLPNLNFAIEFNGLYWHSELYKDKNYHKIKTDMCSDKEIKLLHIWEDDWIYRKDIVKSMILNHINKTPNKIFARKCNIKEINDIQLSKQFLENNHIQGFTGSKVKLGLFYQNELVSYMGFSKKKKNNNWELNRFCNKLNTTVVGGASKLLSYFTKNYSDKIYTFADLSYSNGNLYEKIGFRLDKISNPDYKYVVGNIRKHKFNFRMKNEKQTMLNKEYYRIYNCGLAKYVFDNFNI